MPEPESRQVFRPHIVKLSEYFESIHQVGLLRGRGLKVVGINTDGTEVVVGGGGGKGDAGAVLPESAACWNTAGVRLYPGRNGVGEGNRYRRLLKIERCGKNGASCEYIFIPPLTFVLAFDRKAQTR